MTTKFAKFVSKLISKFIWLLSIVLILFVLVISLLKVSLPYWLKQKDSITDYVESYIGGEFDYQTLQVDWSEFHPIVLLKDLSWKKNSQNFSVQSEHNKIQLDLWRTLYQGVLVTKEVELENLLIKVSSAGFTKQSTDFRLAELKQSIKSAVKGLQHRYVSAVNLEVELTNGDRINKQTIPQLIYKQDKHRKQLVVDTVGELVEKGRLVIESENVIFSQDGNVNYFLDFKRTNLKSLADQFSWTGIADYGQVDLKAWVKQQAEQLDIARVEIKNDSSELAKLDVAIHLALQDGRYQLASERFDISLKQQDDYITHNSFLQLNTANIDGDEHYFIRTGVVPVGFISKSLVPLLDGELSDLNLNLKPSGLINTIEIKLVESAKGLLPVEGKIEVSDFSVSPYLQIPGIQLDKVSIVGSQANWFLTASTELKLLDWRPMFKSTIPVNSLELNAQLKANAPNVLQLDRLYFENKDAKVKARANLNLVDDFSMAIYAEAMDVNVANLHFYWPRNPGLSPNALNYLDQSLLGGKVLFAKFIWQGAVDAFPFKNKDGQFDIQASVIDATFKFQPDWPTATNLNAEASFENESLKISAQSGDLLGAQLAAASALIPDLTAPNEQLLLDIRAKANFDSYQNIYQQSPLMEMLGTELVNISFSDELDIDLKLDFLLANEVKAKVNGLIDFNGNKIAGIPYDIQLTNTQGQLKFTEDGAISRSLNADFLNEPMQIEVKVDEFTDDGSFVQVDAQGSLNLAGISQQLLEFSPLQTTGKSDFFIHYKIDQQENGNESLIVRSDLLGTEIKGPQWLAKNISEVKPLLTTLFKENNKLQIRSSYADQISAQLFLDTDSLQMPTGLIKLGAMATQNLEVPKQGVAIEGYFDQLVVHEWLDAIEFENGGDGEWPNWIERINITTPRLEFAGQAFTKVRINDAKSVGNLDQKVRFNLFSEQARANVTYLKNGQKQLIIENLNLDLQSNTQADSAPVQIDLAEYDNWLFECQLCKINGFEFGSVKLQSQYQDNQIKIAGSALVSDQLSSSINGAIGVENTQLKINFDIPNPDGLLKHWQLSGEIRDTKTTGELSLLWPGRLHDFSLSQTDGHFHLATEEGSIKDLSDKKARIFSLFSLQSIPRRLSLDFTDIFRDGFFYDKITGNFAIKKGVLLSDKVEVKGTAADVLVNGEVDLNQQTVNQQVVVIPKLSSSLPVLAGWAIEPTTGLIMLIVSKIFEPALNVVSSIEYKITGALEDPEVVEVSKKSKEVEVSEEQIEAQKQLLEPESKEIEDNQQEATKEPAQ